MKQIYQSALVLKVNLFWHINIFATYKHVLVFCSTIALSFYKTTRFIVNFFSEFVVDRKYKKEFTNLRIKLGILCAKTIELLNKGKCELLTVKSHLAFSFPELKPGLDNCDSLEKVISDVIRPQLSLIDIDSLQSVYQLFDLSMEPIEEFEEVIREFCKRMKLEHAYGVMLMDELKSHILKVESITFVLRWNGQKESLHDLKDLFDEVVREHQKDIKVIVMHQGNSTVIECFVHLRNMPRVLEALNKERPLHPAIMRIIAQGKEIYGTSSDTDKVMLGKLRMIIIYYQLFL